MGLFLSAQEVEALWQHLSPITVLPPILDTLRHRVQAQVGNQVSTSSIDNSDSATSILGPNLPSINDTNGQRGRYDSGSEEDCGQDMDQSLTPRRRGRLESRSGAASLTANQKRGAQSQLKNHQATPITKKRKGSTIRHHDKRLGRPQNKQQRRSEFPREGIHSILDQTILLDSDDDMVPAPLHVNSRVTPQDNDNMTPASPRGVIFPVTPQPIPEDFSLPERAQDLLDNIAAICRRITDTGVGDIIDQIIKHMTGSPLRDLTGGLPLTYRLAARCAHLDITLITDEFEFILSSILFMMHVECELAAMHRDIRPTKSNLFMTMQNNGQQHDPMFPDYSRLWRFMRAGKKYAILAGGGSFYLLFVLAQARLRTVVVNSLNGNIIGRIAMMLACPLQDGHYGEMIIQDVIPAIALLQKKYPFNVRFFLPDAFCERLGFSLGSLDCSNLEASDAFFTWIPYNSVVKARCQQSWALCLNYTPKIGSQPIYDILQGAEPSVELDGSALAPPVSGSKQNVDEDTFVINTNFDPELRENSKYKHRREDPAIIAEASTRERTRASQAYEAKSLEDFREKLVAQLATGKKPSDENFIRLPAELIKRKIRINDKNGRTMAMIFPTMPDKLRRPLLPIFKTTFAEFVHIDTECQCNGEGCAFPAYHFHYYNRYSVQGHDVESSQEPVALQRSADGKQFQSSQLTPRLSTEAEVNHRIYDKIQFSMQPVYDWVNEQIATHLPHEHQQLSKYVSSLPFDELPPSTPFAGLVYNINAVTGIHRDWNDDSICFVLVVSKCQGGDLVLVEPGIVIELTNGDGIAFRSAEITHFNMHAKGYRASVVFHSDREGKAWLDNFNGWGNNFWFRHTDSLVLQSAL